MTPANPPALRFASLGLPWIDFGELPASLIQLGRERREQTFRLVAVATAAMLGAFAGAVAVLLTPGASAWTALSRAELFVGVTLTAGIGSSFFGYRLVGKLDAARHPTPTRGWVVGSTVQIEFEGGRVLATPLSGVSLPTEPAHGGWYRLVLNTRGQDVVIDVPGAFATAVWSAQGA